MGLQPALRGGAELNADEIGGECPFCAGTGQQLPTEAAVRAAIRETGVDWVEVGVNKTSAVVGFGGDLGWRTFAESGEAEPDYLALLALLRALKAARNG